MRSARWRGARSYSSCAIFRYCSGAFARVVRAFLRCFLLASYQLPRPGARGPVIGDCLHTIHECGDVTASALHDTPRSARSCSRWWKLRRRMIWPSARRSPTCKVSMRPRVSIFAPRYRGVPTSARIHDGSDRPHCTRLATTRCSTISTVSRWKRAWRPCGATISARKSSAASRTRRVPPSGVGCLRSANIDYEPPYEASIAGLSRRRSMPTTRCSSRMANHLSISRWPTTRAAITTSCAKYWSSRAPRSRCPTPART